LPVAWAILKSEKIAPLIWSENSGLASSPQSNLAFCPAVAPIIFEPTYHKQFELEGLNLFCTVEN